MKKPQQSEKGHTGKHPARHAPAKHKPPVAVVHLPTRGAVMGGGGGAGTPVKHQKKPAGKHKPAKKKEPVRKLALGEAVACCSAQALAASARLAGFRVTDADVLALYWRTASHEDAGATIEETLEAAREFGLAGVRLGSFQPVQLDVASLPLLQPHPVSFGEFDDGPARYGVHGLIVGLTLPGGPHAVTLGPSGAAWSWGGLYSLGQLEPEEAWAVRWR